MRTNTSRIRRTVVLLGASLALSSSVALAPTALADGHHVIVGPGIPVQYPDCFGSSYNTGFPYSLGGTWFDEIYAVPGAAVTNGTAGDDVIIGTNGDDHILGLGGNDKICALGGDDTVHGGLVGAAGSDVDDIDGGGAVDSIYGGPDEDHLYGGDSGDLIHGEGGNDYIVGGAGTDALYCDGGVDLADGGTGSDGPAVGTWSGCETYINR